MAYSAPLPPTLGGSVESDGGHPQTPAKGASPLWNPYISHCVAAEAAVAIFSKDDVRAIHELPLQGYFCKK